MKGLRLRGVFLLLSLLFPCYPLLYSQANYFDTTFRLPLSEKIFVAKRIYREQISKLDTADAVKALRLFLQKAEKRKDYAAQGLAYTFLGLHYWKRNKQKEQGIHYFTKGINISRDNNELVSAAIGAHDLGLQYFQHHIYDTGFEYMLRGNKLMKEVGYARYPNISKYLYELGYVCFSAGYLDKAVTFLREANQFPFQNPQYGMWINNTLALSYREQGQLDSAFYFFNRAMKYAADQNDTFWVGLISGNIASVHMDRGEFDKALPLLRLDYLTSLQYDKPRSAANATRSLARIALENGDLRLVYKYIDTCRQLMEKVDGFQESSTEKFHYYNVLADIYFKEKKWQQAYIALDSEYVTANILWNNNKRQLLSQVEAKIEIENHLADLRLAESERDRLLLRRNAMIAVLAMLVIIVLQMLWRLRQKWYHAKSLLDSYADRLQQNARLIENLKEVNNTLRNTDVASPENREQEEIVETLYSFAILKEEDWKEFKVLFSQVYGDFLGKLQRKYPEITQGETRFLALLKIGLSINAMANALGVSPASVRKTRYRLLKKLNISEEELRKVIGVRK
jgi:tetratricopeptide (TPR) repeat protein